MSHLTVPQMSFVSGKLHFPLQVHCRLATCPNTMTSGQLLIGQRESSERKQQNKTYFSLYSEIQFFRCYFFLHTQAQIIHTCRNRTYKHALMERRQREGSALHGQYLKVCCLAQVYLGSAHVNWHLFTYNSTFHTHQSEQVLSRHPSDPQAKSLWNVYSD